MARIAVIDDSINDGVLKTEVKERYIYEAGSFKRSYSKPQDKITHGTLIAKVFETYAVSYEIVSIQLLENWFKQQVCSVSSLVKALEFCETLDIDLIHISLGTEKLSDYRFLKDAIQEIEKLNIPMVAACSNYPCRTIPASCKSVFGVIADQHNLLSGGEYVTYISHYLGTQFMADYELDIPLSGKIGKSNSLAAAVISANVNEYLNKKKKKCTFDEIFAYLQHNAKKNIEVPKGRVYLDDETPIVCLGNSLSTDEDKQIEIINIFAQNGYEAIGISYHGSYDDVRLLEGRCFNECSSLRYEEGLLTVPNVDIILVFEEISSFLNNYRGYLKQQNNPMIQHNIEHIKKLEIDYRSCKSDAQKIFQKIMRLFS